MLGRDGPSETQHFIYNNKCSVLPKSIIVGAVL